MGCAHWWDGDQAHSWRSKEVGSHADINSRWKDERRGLQLGGAERAVGGRPAVVLLQSRRNRWDLGGGPCWCRLGGAPSRRASPAWVKIRSSEALQDAAGTSVSLVEGFLPLRRVDSRGDRPRARPLSERPRPMAGSLSAPSTWREGRATCRGSSARVQDGLSPPSAAHSAGGTGDGRGGWRWRRGRGGGACGSRAGCGDGHWPTRVRRGGAGG
jgi:hypothetical protein